MILDYLGLQYIQASPESSDSWNHTSYESPVGIFWILSSLCIWDNSHKKSHHLYTIHKGCESKGFERIENCSKPAESVEIWCTMDSDGSCKIDGMGSGWTFDWSSSNSTETQLKIEGIARIRWHLIELLIFDWLRNLLVFLIYIYSKWLEARDVVDPTAMPSDCYKAFQLTLRDVGQLGHEDGWSQWWSSDACFLSRLLVCML